MASRLFSSHSVPSVRRMSSVDTPKETPSTFQSGLKRSIGSTSDLITPAFKRRAYADPATQTPTSAERISIEQARRALTGQISALERQLVDLQKQVRDAQAELGERDRRVARLEEDRKIIAEREVEAKAQRRDAVASLREAKDAAEKERDRQIARANDRDEAATKAELAARREKHEADLARTTAASAVEQLETLQMELAKSDEEIARVRILLEEADLIKSALEASVDDLKSRSRGNAEETDQQSKLVREELHRQVNHLKTLEGSNARLTRENNILKERAAESAVLRERVHVLENKLKLTDQLRRDLAAEQAETERLQQLHEEWLAYLHSDEEATTQQWDSPRQVGRALGIARIELAGLQERVEQLSAQIKARDVLVEALEIRLDESELAMRTQNEQHIDIEAKRRRDARMLDLIKRENDLLREQLRSYAVEETSIGGEPGQRAEAIVGLEELLDTHQKALHDSHAELERLQGILEAHGGMTDLLEAEKSETMTAHWRRDGKLGESLAEQIKVNEILRSELAEAVQDAKRAASDLRSLEATCERLQSAVDRGEYNSSTTRVLQLTDNPASRDVAIRSATLEALKTENTALLARLARVSTDAANAAADVPIETLDGLRKEIDRLTADLEQKEKKAQRVRETFSQQAQHMRNAIYALLGYKCDFRDSGRIRVTSMFARNDDDHLIFEPIDVKKGAPMRLRLAGGTGDAAWTKAPSVQSAISFWVDERQSIPCFLSALTLEAYDANTSGGKALGFTQA